MQGFGLGIFNMNSLLINWDDFLVSTYVLGKLMCRALSLK